MIPRPLDDVVAVGAELGLSRPLRVIVALVGDLESVIKPCGCGRQPNGGLARLGYLVNDLRRSGASVWTYGKLFEHKGKWEAADGLSGLRERLVREFLEEHGLAANHVQDGQGLHVMANGTVSSDSCAAGTIEIKPVRGRSGAYKDLRGNVLRVGGPRHGRGIVVVDVMRFQAATGLAVTFPIYCRVLGAIGEDSTHRELEAKAYEELTRGTIVDVGITPVEDGGPYSEAGLRLESKYFAALRDAGWVVQERGDSICGPEDCGRCHADEYARWRDGAHARAFERLGIVRRHEPACVVCHVTGARTGNNGQGVVFSLGGVTCEECHGAGEGHPDQRKRMRRPGRSECVACHNRERSPGFSWTVYKERLACTGR